MKLQNKITGRVLKKYTIRALEGVDADKGNEKIVLIDDETHDKWAYYTLAAFNDEWQDYEEPETYYYISDLGNIEIRTKAHCHNLPEEIWYKALNHRKEIGNYFETKEEAEKAVEKLKALKRLEANGFEFDGWKRDEKYCGDFTITASDYTSCDDEDLNLLFGGKK